MATVASGATAFAHRQAPIMVPADALIDALRPNAVGVYANFVADEGAARVREAYPGLTYQRLGQVKRRYDPTNLFHLDQNIRPAVES